MSGSKEQSNTTPESNIRSQPTYDLLSGLKEAKITIDLFLNNNFEEAKTRPKNGMYQSLAHSTLLFVQGTATIERGHLDSASSHILHTLKMCDSYRRKGELKEIFAKRLAKPRIAIFKQYTDVQAHAELCFAEGLLQLAFLNLLKDDNFASLLRSSLKIRQCYKCYRLCWGILKHREWESGLSKSTFESGVRLGVGAFNMMISLLPERVLKLLEFVGFSGDRKLGLAQLRMGSSMLDSLRAPLCALLLLVYDLYATQMLGDTVSSVAFEKPDQIMEAKELLQHWQATYPKSAIFQLLSGRYHALTGDLEQAIDIFKTSITLPLDWAQYRHMCYWELLWCYALRADWLSAVKYVEKLACESQWSQASYRYMKAAFLLQHLDDPGVALTPTSKQSNSSACGNNEEDYRLLYQTPEEIYKHIDKLLSEIPNMMHRFAGRSLPLEKVALRKSKRYFEQDRKLTLPALELMFIWNSFKLVQCQQDSVMTFLLICENKINYLLQNKDQFKHYHDEYSLALLLKGVCLRCRNQLYQASMCFKEILDLKKQIKVDTYLLPFCQMELCQLAFDEGNIPEAQEHLKRALRYKKYSLESRLHFRMHEMKNRLKACQNDKKGNSSDPQMAQSPSSQSIQSVESSNNKDLLQLPTRTADGDSDSVHSSTIFPDIEDDLDVMNYSFSTDEEPDLTQ